MYRIIKRIEDVVTNKLGYEGVDPHRREVLRMLEQMGTAKDLQETDIELKLHLAKMEGYDTEGKLREVMDKLGYEYVGNQFSEPDTQERLAEETGGREICATAPLNIYNQAIPAAGLKGFWVRKAS